MSEVIPLSERRPPQDTPDQQELDAIRKRVEERIQQEAAATPGEEKKGGGGGEITSRFIRDCLRMNELGDGLLFRELHRGKFVYNVSMGMWMVWAGHHWEIDMMGQCKAAVENVVAKYIEEAVRVSAELKDVEEGSTAHAQLKDLRDDLNKRIWALRSRRRRDSCLDQASSCEDGLVVKGNEFDQNQWLLACSNCVIDLRTGKARDGRPEDYLLKASTVEWKGIDAPCDRWVNFLRMIFMEDHIGPDEDHPVTDFIQRLMGYAILGSDMLHIFPVWTGKGRNGKGTIVKVMRHIMGPLSESLRPEMLLDQGRNASAGGPTPHIIALRGLRMAFASETNEGCKISAAEVKRLTGGDPLSGRSPHDKFDISFDPTHTLFLLTNYLPHKKADDFAFWERCLVVHFPLSFVDREPAKEHERRADIGLIKKLIEQDAGILAWLVKGCLIWQKHGLQPPPKVVAEVKDYQQAEDNVGAFVDYACYLDEKAWVGASQLYQAFEEWWKKFVSRNPILQKKFGTLMRKRFKAEKVGGVYRYYGIGLLEQDHLDDS